MVNVEVIVLSIVSFLQLVNCSLENDDKDNEISVDSEAKTNKNSGGHCTNEDCYEFKPIQIYVPHSPLIPCDKV